MRQHVFGSNAALVLFYHMLGNGQTQACAVAGATAVSTEKSGEDVRQLGFVHTHAIVGNVDQQFLLDEAAIDVDHAALRAVLDGVAQNIVKSLIQIAFIGVNDDGLFTRLQLLQLLFFFCQRHGVGHQIGNKIIEKQVFVQDLRGFVFQSCQGQQFADQAVHAP